MIAPRPHSLRRTPPAAVLAAALGVCAVGPASAENRGAALVAAWAESLRGAGRTVEWSRLEEHDGDRLELSDVVVTVPTAVTGKRALRIEIPRVTLVGAVAPDRGGLVLGSLTLPSLSLTTSGSGPRRVAMLADAEIRDLTLPPLPALSFDRDTPTRTLVEAGRWFDGVSATLVRLGRSTTMTDGTRPREATTIDLRDARIAGVGAGRIERIGIAALDIDVTSKVGSTRLSLTDPALEGWDLGAWRHVLDDRAPDTEGGDTPWRRALTRFSSGRMALSTAAANLSVDRIASGPHAVRRFPEPPGRVADRLWSRPADASPDDLSRLLLDLFLATRGDDWSIHGLHLTGGDLAHADVARLAITSVGDADRRSDLTLEGLDVVAAKATLRVDRFAVAGLRLPDADDLRRAVAARRVGAEIDPSSLLPTFTRLDLARFELGEPGVPALTLGRLVLDLADFVRAVPGRVDAAFEHLVVPAGLAEIEGRRLLAGLGYDRIDLSGGLAARWIEATREVEIDTARLAVADLGEATLTARLTGVSRSLLVRPDTLAEALGGIRLAAAEARIVDRSFLDRLIRLVARDEKIPPARLRRRLAAELAAELGPIRDAERRRGARAAVRAFVAKPGAITLVARPRTPIPLKDLPALAEDPFDLVERLDLSVPSGR